MNDEENAMATARGEMAEAETGAADVKPADAERARRKAIESDLSALKEEYAAAAEGLARHQKRHWHPLARKIHRVEFGYRNRPIPLGRVENAIATLRDALRRLPELGRDEPLFDSNPLAKFEDPRTKSGEE